MDTSAKTFMSHQDRYCAANYQPVPVVIERASDVWLWDVEGRRYIDMMSAYSAVSHGHLHPRVVDAAVAQMENVAVTSRAYYSAVLGSFLEKLCQISGFERALPMNTGAEAVETAIKAARRWGYRVKGIAPDQAEILVAKNNFHGRTTTAISASSEEGYRADFGPLTPGFRWFEFGNIDSIRAATGPNTCAVLIEPIQGEAGIIPPPAGFFKALREWCTQNQILLILDEVQAGLGRTGRWFAFEHEGIRPDGLVVGKALGGGLLPVSAFLANTDVMDVFTPGSHGSTFGGNALAAAVGLTALQVLEDENLVARSAALGQHLLWRLRRLRCPVIQGVHGRGLWLGVEINPALASAREIVYQLAQEGVLTKETHETIIRFAPPLTISKATLDTAIDIFEKVLGLWAEVRYDENLLEFKPVAMPQLLMSPPDFFEVSYAINPWMDPSQWALQAERLSQDASQGWQALKTCYEKLGAKVHVKPPEKGWPDLVFTANCAVVLDGKALLAQYKHPERAGEQIHDQRLFEQLLAAGHVTSLHYMPENVYFEGAGDAIFDAQRQIMWMGWGQRSHYEARHVVEKIFDIPTIALELIDPRFYHLDTCFCLLSGGEVIYYPKALSHASRAQVAAVVGEQGVIASDEDAEHLGVNSVCIGRDVVLCYCSQALRTQLEILGYRVHVIDLGAFNRSGGAAYCLTLALEHQHHTSV